MSHANFPLPDRRMLVLLVLPLALTCCSGPPSSSGAWSFEEARALVLDQIIDPSKGTNSPVIAFGWPKPLEEGDVLHAFEKQGFEPFPERHLIEQESWFFWIDDAAGALFMHPSRFVLVERESGKFQVWEEQWWPVLNNETLWPTEEEYWNSDNWIYSNLEAERSSLTPNMLFLPQDSSALPVSLSLEPQKGPNAQEANGAALVLNGFLAGERLEGTLSESADQMHDIFSSAGLDTTYYGPKGDTDSRLDGELTYSARNRWFDEKSKELKAGQTLFIYLTGHGGVSPGGLTGLGGYYEDQLKANLAKFDPGVHIIVVLDGCYSGGFLDSLKDVADISISSTSEDKEAYGDMDTWFFSGDINPEDEGLEFTSGFVEDWNTLMKSSTSKQGLQQRAVRTGDNFWEQLAVESNTSAVEKDFGASQGWTEPQLQRGSPATRPPTAKSSSETSQLMDDSLDAFQCANGDPLSKEAQGMLDLLLVEMAAVEDPERHYEFYVEFEALLEGEPIAGGVEFYDQSRPISSPDPNWWFNGKGNLNFSFLVTPSDVLAEVYSFEDGLWKVDDSKVFDVEARDGKIVIDIPAELVPEDSPFYVSLTDSMRCDQLGLNTETLLPELRLLSFTSEPQ